MERSAANRRSSALPRTAERLVPWFAAGILIGGLNVVVTLLGGQPTMAERAFMILALSAAIAVAGLVAVRSGKQLTAVDREERGRPAPEQLLAARPAHEVSASTYVETMARWAEAMLELTDHAAQTDAAHVTGAVGELSTASENARELADLLRASLEAPLAANDMAILHNLCAMWDADQERVELLASEMDPLWHRTWQARTVVERLFRGGGRRGAGADLPYRHVPVNPYGAPHDDVDWLVPSR
jgi:hypothetical protein